MRAVHFGAGNIGRGFIGPMLSNSGYRVCFVGRNKNKVEQLQVRGQYPITLANEKRDSYIIDNVTAVNLADTEEVAREIAEAGIVTTAVGVSALNDIAATIARGIEIRLGGANPRPLHVIACENGVASSQHLKNSVYKYLNSSLRKLADSSIAFPNVMVDRIVPVQKNKDPLEVLVEPFSEWVIPRQELIGNHDEIKGAHYVDTLAPYLERKLFTVNTGHCSAAYFGYLEGYTNIQEAMSDPGIRAQVHGVLMETGALLMKSHGFDPDEHRKYIEKMMLRFMNPNFRDTLTRVGRSPLRKLSPKERLVHPALLAYDLGLETPYLISAITSALFFDYKKDPEAILLQEMIRNQGISEIIVSHLKIPQEHPLHDRIIEKYNITLMRYPHMATAGFESMKLNL